MSDIGLGLAVRSLRRRLEWRQRDLAHRAGISQQHVSRVERGLLDDVTLRTLRQVAAPLGASVLVELRWRGGELERLVDRRHAAIASKAVSILDALGYVTQPEVTYAIYGERGSIDVLATDRTRHACVVVEVKSELTSIERTLRKHDEKARLAPQIVRQRLGWAPTRVLRLLVLPDESSARRAVARHADLLRRPYPKVGREARGWLTEGGHESGGGILFVAPTPGRSASCSRVRRADAGTRS